MAWEPDELVDRRRLKRQISLWRSLALLAAIGVIAALASRDGLVGEHRHVARLTVNGLIVDDPRREKALVEVAQNAAAAALIVRIDSPGGTVVGGESLFRQLRAVAEVKPVVAQMGEVAASGGYMIALAADHIVAREGTITGSIGVIMQTTDLTGLLSKLGIQAEAIKSAPLKAVPSPLEPLTEAGREATRAVVLDMYDMFVNMVAERRKLPIARARELADGRVFTGRQAQSAGLIDALGGENEARTWLQGRGVGTELPVREVQIQREDDGWRDLFTSMIHGLVGKVFLSERLTLDGLVAVWHPDLSRH